MSWDIFSKSKIQYFLEKLKGKFVQKETGKGLSTNDFDNTYKSKVDKIDVSSTSVSGNPISISGLKTNQLAVNPIITFEPIQDLHGQSKPYPNGGSPTNLLAATSYGGDLYNRAVGTDLKISTHLPDYSFNNTRTVVSVEITTAWRGRLFATGKLTAGTYYVAPANLTGNTSPRCTIYVTDSDLNVVSVVTNWSNPGIQVAQSVTLTANQRIAIGILSGGTETIKVGDFFVGAGSGSGYVYSPFENICPISGYDKIEVLSCGKNLFDGTYSVTGKYLMADGSEYAGAFNISQYISVKSNTAYYFSNLSGATSACICWYNKAKEFISATNIIEAFTETSPANACYVRASVHNTRTDVCINEGNTAITYVPYDKTTSISESLGQTVYKGSLDVRTGLFTVTHAYVDLGSLTWTYNSSVATFIASDLPKYAKINGNANPPDIVCSQYDKIRPNGYNAGQNNTISLGNTDPSIYVWIKDSRYTDATTFGNAMSGVQLVYKLATPFTIQLTPHEISLLKDYTYVSTNGTNIALDYHNGELASLADVSQLGETVNELSQAFQDGCDEIVQAVTAKYQVPASNSPDDISEAINRIPALTPNCAVVLRTMTSDVSSFTVPYDSTKTVILVMVIPVILTGSAYEMTFLVGKLNFIKSTFDYVGSAINYNTSDDLIQTGSNTGSMSFDSTNNLITINSKSGNYRWKNHDTFMVAIEYYPQSN